MATTVPYMRTVALTCLGLGLLLLLLTSAIQPVARTAGAAQDDELERLRAELNATRAENVNLSAELNATKSDLKDAQTDRDAYAERLESSTTILFLALVLISIATAFYWWTARRQSMVMRGMRDDATKPQRPPRRRG